jgi:gluconolactonase
MTLLAEGATLRQLHTGMKWGEGPVVLPGGTCLRWTDVGSARIHEMDLPHGAIRTIAEASDKANGQTLTRAGEVVVCVEGARTVRIEGRFNPVVASNWSGHRFNSPNDVVEASDRSIWFTDPPYGLMSATSEILRLGEYGGCWVFRVDGTSGVVTPVITDMEHPNGLAFSPDETLLYVADSSRLVSPTGRHHVRVYDVESGECRNGRDFCRIESGVPDGIHVDTNGRLWCSSHGAVLVYSATGELLETIAVPETVTNLCLDSGGTLYITTAHSLYSIATLARPAVPVPPRRSI